MFLLFSRYTACFLIRYGFSMQVEYVIVKFDHENKVARLSLRGGEILKKLNEKEALNPE